MFNCISLDFDGTICDTKNSIKCTLNDLFPLKKDEEINNIISKGLSLKDTLAYLSDSNINDDDISALVLAYREKYNKEYFVHQKLYPYVKEVIEDLHHKGILTVIVSNKGEKSIHDFLDKNKLTHAISLVVGSRSDVKSKPNTDSWDKVIKKQFTSLSLSNVLHVGDTELDIEYAKNLNIRCGYVTYGFGRPVSDLILKPDFIFEEFNDILKII
ncbi:hypothetical protein KP22_14210 [Pectobacterium betavasculorum]|uniref:phosphoglycolate phosphatase n=1 Tax=Pectobacterium betavasculorum TaxID=55207 RepID=A0A093RU60_9GAMM|nr:HAD family hydrolase [Pectobacterium betavasculorum]KFX04004.1 hypothetical protein KP22_14210 [Pectobacterium betavasculorum]KFX20045.1 hypothetical protein JV35_11300 [Pectobacterium betavasculorum]